MADVNTVTLSGKLLSRGGSRGPRAVEIQAKVITPPKQARSKQKAESKQQGREELPIIDTE